MAVTTGYVQRSTVNASVYCVWVGPVPTSTELLLLSFSSSDTPADATAKRTIASVLAEAEGGGRHVAVGHPDESAAITDCAITAPDLEEQPVNVDAIEVTQSVQDLSQSVALIAGKRTVVRVYVSKHSGPPRTVGGEISVRQGPSDPPLVVPSLNSTTLYPAQAGDVTLQRTDENRSLNFVLDPGQTAEGPLAISLSRLIRNNGTELPFATTRQSVVYFHRSPPLRLRVVGIRYQYSDPADAPPVTILPANIDYGHVLSWLQRAYPVAQVVSSQVLVNAPGGPVFSPDDKFDSDDINAHVAAIRALDLDGGIDARTLYYGIVSDAGFFMRGKVGGPFVSCGPTGPGDWGWDFDGSYGDWYAGHEIGHSLGRPHVGACGESGFDDRYPFPSGQLSATDDGFTGFDVGDPVAGLPTRALSGTLWHDVMTYCDYQWTSVYTYREIRRRLMSVDDMPAHAPGAPVPASESAGAGRPDRRYPERQIVQAARPGVDHERDGEASTATVSVVATVNLTQRSGAIRYVNPMQSLAPAPGEPEGHVTLVVRRADGGEVARHGVPVTLDPERGPDEDQVGLVDAVIPVPGAAAAIELVVHDTVADVFRPGAMPSVRGIRHRASSARRIGLDLELDEPFAEGASFAAQISTDAGRTWETIAVGLREPHVELDCAHVPAGSEVRVRIVASNGLASSRVMGDTVRL